jgi:hypothetical protein
MKERRYESRQVTAHNRPAVIVLVSSKNSMATSRRGL